MYEQTRKALELAREALTGCTDSLEYVNRLALGAVDFDVRYERISIAGKAIAAIDAALSAPAAPVAPAGAIAWVRKSLADRRFREASEVEDLLRMAANVIAEDGVIIEHLKAKIAAPAAPVAQPLTKTEFARLWCERMGATRFSNYEWEAKQITELAHGIGQGEDNA